MKLKYKIALIIVVLFSILLFKTTNNTQYTTYSHSNTFIIQNISTQSSNDSESKDRDSKKPNKSNPDGNVTKLVNNAFKYLKSMYRIIKK